MKINSKTKGSSAERDVAKLIFDYTGIKLIRNLEQTRSGGYDLIVHPDEVGPVSDNFRRLAIESKRYRQADPVDIKGWWKQTVFQAEMAELEPILIYRADRRDWTVIAPLHYVRPDFGMSDAFDLTLSMSIHVFCCIVREKGG
jgi:Holliday junction resolvase